MSITIFIFFKIVYRWIGGNIEITECIGCSRYNYCNTTRCRMINKVMCGSLHTPSAIVCSIENLKVKLSEYYLQRNIANL